MINNKGNDKNNYRYWYSCAGMSDVLKVNAAYLAEQREADRKARMSMYCTTHDDFLDFLEKHPHTEPVAPSDSVFNGVTNLGVVKPAGKHYYEKLHEEVKSTWEAEVTKALNRAILPDGHPRKLEVVVEKVH